MKQSYCIATDIELLLDGACRNNGDILARLGRVRRDIDGLDLHRILGAPYEKMVAQSARRLLGGGRGTPPGALTAINDRDLV